MSVCAVFCARAARIIASSWVESHMKPWQSASSWRSGSPGDDQVRSTSDRGVLPRRTVSLPVRLYGSLPWN